MTYDFIMFEIREVLEYMEFDYLEDYSSICELMTGQAICTYGDRIYVYAGKSNCLISFDLCGTNTIVYRLPNDIEYMYAGCCIIDNVAYLIPYHSKYFLSVDLLKKTITKIEIGMSLNEINSNCKYVKAILSDGIIYVIGEKIHTIMQLKVANGLNVVKRYKYDDAIFWCNNNYEDEKTIYLVSRNCNVIFTINKGNGKIVEHHIKKDGESGFCDIFFKNKEIIVIDKKGERYIFNGSEGLIRTDIYRERIISWYSYCYKDVVFRLDARSCRGILEKKDGDEIIVISKEKNDSLVPFQGTLAMNSTIFFMTRTGKFFRLEIESGNITELFITGEYVLESIFSTIARKKACREGNEGNLQIMLRYLSNKEKMN